MLATYESLPVSLARCGGQSKQSAIISALRKTSLRRLVPYWKNERLTVIYYAKKTVAMRACAAVYAFNAVNARSRHSGWLARTTVSKNKCAIKVPFNYVGGRSRIG